MKRFVTASSLFLSALVTLCGCEKTDFIEKGKPEVDLQADPTRLVTSVVHLYSDTTYIVSGNLNINAGQKLIVDAGTLVKVRNAGSVNINTGGSIEARGTSDEPIVFTSAALKGSQAFIQTASPNVWNGFTVYGPSTVTSPVVLNFVRIEFCDGLGLYSLDSTASIHNVQVSYAQDNSFYISGGNMRAYNLVSYAASGSDYRLAGGYTGLLQNLVAYRHPYFPAAPQATIAGMYIEGAATFPSVSNLSVVGPGSQVVTVDAYRDNAAAGVIVRGPARLRIKNSAILGFPKGALNIADATTANSLQFGPSVFAYNTVQSEDTSRLFYLPNNIYAGYTADDFRGFMLGRGAQNFQNQHLLTVEAFGLASPFDYDNNLSLLPVTGSLLLGNTDFGDPVFSGPFFKKHTYRGALGQEDWQQGWVNYKPLQTQY